MKRSAGLLCVIAGLQLGSAGPASAQDGASGSPAGLNDGAFDLALPPEEDLQAGPESSPVSPEPIEPDAVSPEGLVPEEIPFRPGVDGPDPSLDGGEAPPMEPGFDPAGERAAASPDEDGVTDPAAETPPDEPDAPAEEAGTPAAPNPFFSLSLEALEATRSAPLFTPSRTAPAAAEPAPEPEPVPVEEEPVETAATPPPLQLIGIVVAGEEEVAILSDSESGQVVRLQPGEEHQGWKLKILDGQSVELSSDGQTQKLTMFTEFPNAPVQSTPDPEGEDPAMGDPDFDDMDGERAYDENGEPITPER